MAYYDRARGKLTEMKQNVTLSCQHNYIYVVYHIDYRPEHCNDMYFPSQTFFLQFVDNSMSVNTIHYIENKLEIRNLKRTSNMKCSNLDKSYMLF